MRSIEPRDFSLLGTSTGAGHDAALPSADSARRALGMRMLISLVLLAVGCVAQRHVSSSKLPIRAVSSDTIQITVTAAEEREWGSVVYGRVVATKSSMDSGERLIHIQLQDSAGKVLDEADSPYFPGPRRKQVKPILGHFSAVFPSFPGQTARILVSAKPLPPPPSPSPSH